MDKVLRAAIYIRVSTAEQAIHGKSLQAQREYLEKYAADNGMQVIGIYADEGQTARKELKKRKSIHRLLADVEKNVIDIILFWKMDRWFRSVSDFYKVQDILDAHHVRWIAVAEPNINMETRDGRLQLNIMLSIGQNEVDTTSERIKFTVNNMIENGRLVWGENNMPLGYKIETIDGEKKMVKDEQTAPIVEEFFQYYMKYQAKKRTVVHIQEMFHIDFSYSMLRTMLTSEFYIGKYRNKTDYCPAYLTPEQWKMIQKISKRNIKTSRSDRVYYFSSLIRCPLCGQKLAGCGCSSIINRKTGEKRTYCYYRCNRSLIDNICSFRYKLSQNMTEDYLLKTIEPEFKKYKLYCESIGTKKKRRKGRTSSSINNEMERLNVLFQKGRVSFDYYEKQYALLENELKETAPEEPVKIQSYSYLIDLFSKDFLSMYKKLSEEKKQVFWRQIIAEIYIDTNGKIIGFDFI